MQQVWWGVSHGQEAGPEKYPLVINGGDPAAGGAQQKEEPQPPVGEEGVLTETSVPLLTSSVLFLELLLCSVICVEVYGWGRAFGAEEPGKGIHGASVAAQWSRYPRGERERRLRGQRRLDLGGGASWREFGI